MPRRETGAVAQFPAALQSQLPLSSFDFMVVSGCWLHNVSAVQVISKNPTQGDSPEWLVGLVLYQNLLLFYESSKPPHRFQLR